MNEEIKEKLEMHLAAFASAVMDKPQIEIYRVAIEEAIAEVAKIVVESLPKEMPDPNNDECANGYNAYRNQMLETWSKDA